MNYEDAPFDLISELSSEFHPRNGITYLIPKWRPITFSIPSDVPTNEQQAASSKSGQPPLDFRKALFVVQQMVNLYNESGNPGRFTLREEGNYLHIEQTARMIDGQLQPFTPISQMVAKWSPKSESCHQVLNDLFTTISAQYGVKFAEGSVPMGSLLTSRCSVTAASLSVGQVLEGVIAGLETDPSTGKVAPEATYAWQLVYEPNWNKYFLNLEVVRHYGPVSAQTGQPNTTVSKTESNRSSGRVGAYNSAKP